MAKGLDLEKLILAAAEQLEVDPALINSSSRQRAVAQARSIICCLAVDQLKIKGAEVARKLELSPSAVSKLANRGRKEGIASKVADRIFDL
jgi:chromosomal replication initiation ATPase DnaA